MRRPFRPKAVRAGPKVLFIDSFQNHRDRPLRHLVFEGRDAERPLRAIRFRDVGSPHRRSLIAARFDAFEEVRKIGLQVRLILVRRDPIDACRPILARQRVGFLHPFHIDDVVQREQHLARFPPRQVGYPLSFRGQVREVHVLSRVSRQWVSTHDASLPSFGSR